MSGQHTELERRVSDTLQAVGSQVGPADSSGFERIRAELIEVGPTGGRTSTGPRIWLAAAVLAVMGLTGGGLFLLQDRLAPDRPGSTQAAEDSGLAAQDDGATENGSDDGGPTTAGQPEENLFLLPPTDADVSSGLYFNALPSGDNGEAIVVGRRTETGFDRLAMIAHQRFAPSFGGATESVELAGRLMVAPVVDPESTTEPSAAEKLPDGTWLEYTAGEGHQLLEEVAAATTFEDGRIVFDTAASGLAILGEVSDLSAWDSTIVSHPALGTEPIAADQNPFTLITAVGGSEVQLLNFGVYLGPMERTMINDRPGFLIDIPREQTDLDYDVTGMAWSTATGHSVLLITALNETEARDFAATLTSVDEQTWLETLEEIGGMADRHLLATSTMELGANEITVLLEDREVRLPVTGNRNLLEVDSDAGTWNEYTTLELTWFEDEQEHRINFYVQSDGTDWWVDEIRTYDGEDNPEWIITEGEFFRTPLGEAFRGALEIEHLRITNLTLEAFPRPSVCDTQSTGVAIVPSEPVIEFPLDPEEAPGAGYGASFRVLDTETCTPLSSEGVKAAAALDNPLASLNPTTFEDGVLRVSMTFLEQGRATLSVEVRADDGGEALALVRIPVIVGPGQ